MPTSPNLGFTYPTPLDPATADLWGGILNTLFLELDSEAATKTIAQSFADFELSRAKLVDTSETVHNAGNISGAVTLDYENGSYQYATLTGDVTSLTISNLPASGSGGWLTLELNQDGTGSRLLTLGSAYKTAGGGGVTLSTGASERDYLFMFTRDAGTTIFVNPTYNWS